MSVVVPLRARHQGGICSITFFPTTDDLLAAYRLKLVTAVKSKRVMLTYMVGSVILGAACGAGAWLWHIASVPVAVLVGCGYWIFFLSALFAASYLRLPKQVRKIFAQQKALHAETTVEWSDTGISFVSARGESRFEWSDYMGAAADRDVVILLQSEVMMNFIPTRTLTQAQVDEIVRSVKA